MRRTFLAASFVVCFGVSSARGQITISGVTPRVTAAEIILTLEASADVSSVRASSVLTCDQYAADKRVSPSLTATADPTAPTITEITFRMPADSTEKADYIVCVASDPQSKLTTSPKIRIDVAGPRQLAEAEKRLQIKDDEKAKKYEPPKRVFFDSVEVAPGRVTLFFNTPSFGSVRARIKDGFLQDASPQDRRHKFEFTKLAEGTKYAFEAWVVDASGNQVADSRTDTDTQGKPLEYTIPTNPGEVGAVTITPIPRSKRATLNVTIDREGSVRIVTRRKIDEKNGVFGPPQSQEAKFVAGKRDYSLDFENLEPGSKYEYVVTTVNAYGAPKQLDARSFETPPVFAFKDAIEVSLTPIGFLVTLKASDQADTAGLRVKGKGFFRETSSVLTSNEAKLSLSLEDTKVFLKAGDAQPTLEVFMKKGTEEISQQLKVAFEPLETAKAKIQSLTLDQTEKDKLAAAVENVSKKKWGETWGNVVPAVFKLALTFLK